MRSDRALETADSVVCYYFLANRSDAESVDPNAFIAEVYRRMAARQTRESAPPAWPEIKSSKIVLHTLHQYAPYLPAEKTARILDIGFGSGWFLAACVK